MISDARIRRLLYVVRVKFPAIWSLITKVARPIMAKVYSINVTVSQEKVLSDSDDRVEAFCVALQSEIIKNKKN